MKKLIYSLFLMAVAAMTFTACSDVPEPYENPNSGKKRRNRKSKATLLARELLKNLTMLRLPCNKSKR